MKQQRVIVLNGSDYASDMQKEKEINVAIAEGWFIVSVTAQHVATATTSTRLGGFLVVLERPAN
jgi:hypothetical protein